MTATPKILAIDILGPDASSTPSNRIKIQGYNAGDAGQVRISFQNINGAVLYEYNTGIIETGGRWQDTITEIPGVVIVKVGPTGENYWTSTINYDGTDLRDLFQTAISPYLSPALAEKVSADLEAYERAIIAGTGEYFIYGGPSGVSGPGGFVTTPPIGEHPPEFYRLELTLPHWMPLRFTQAHADMIDKRAGEFAGSGWYITDAILRDDKHLDIYVTDKSIGFLVIAAVIAGWLALMGLIGITWKWIALKNNEVIAEEVDERAATAIALAKAGYTAEEIIAIMKAAFGDKAPGEGDKDGDGILGTLDKLAPLLIVLAVVGMMKK